MPLVAAKCTQCGANLEIDDSLEAAVCKFCNSAFIVEKAINNYNTYNQNTYNFENAQLFIQDEKSIENKLKNADVFFIKHNDKQKAFELFEDVSNNAPGDYRGWWGMARVMTEEFTYVAIGSRKFDEILNYTTRALNVAPPDIASRLKKTWDNFSNGVNSHTNDMLAVKEELEKEKNDTFDKLKEYRLQKEEIGFVINSKKDKQSKLLNKLKKRKFNDKGCLIAIGYIIGFILTIKYKYVLGLSILIPLILSKILLKRSINKINNEIALLEAEYEDIEKHIESEENIYRKQVNKIDNIHSSLIS
jgi:hypothetical protein